MVKFSASKARNKFDSTASELQIEEDRSASTPNQEYQKLEGKLNHDLTEEKSGSEWGVIALVIFPDYLLMM